jgi:AcrR family transcriptional regulator
MPKLWNETIEAHRRAVRDAAADTTAALVTQRGLRSVTMSQIAAETGIARATLYKYFPDVEAILVAWHEREVARHLAYLEELRNAAEDAESALEAVLEAYALIRNQHDSGDLSRLLHEGEHVERAQDRLRSFLTELLSEARAMASVRDDVAPDELANYCLCALAGASALPSKAAVRRLVRVTLAGVQPQR